MALIRIEAEYITLSTTTTYVFLTLNLLQKICEAIEIDYEEFSFI